MKRNIIKLLIIIFVISINIGCDQSTKFYASKLLKNTGTIHLVDNYFILKYAENNGGFLSVFSNLPHSIRFIILTIIPIASLLIFSIFVLFNTTLSTTSLIAIGCIIGGGFGNLLDRLFNNGYVIDFMNLGIGNIRTGIFNFADLSIMLGMVLLLITRCIKRKECFLQKDKI